MKIFAFALAVAAFGLGQPALAQKAAPVDLKSPEAQASYAIGLNLGAILKRDSITADPAIVAQGIRDVLAGTKPAMTEQQVRAVLTRLDSEITARRTKQIAELAAANKAEGAAFLKANGAKPGVVTLPSGLQYQILTAGTGPMPKESDTVTCNYRGTLLDGTEFDSSYKRGAPGSFKVGGVISGWTEALQLMPVGSKWRLFVPAELGYGEQGAGRDIPPNATLIFEIELLSKQG